MEGKRQQAFLANEPPGDRPASQRDYSATRRDPVPMRVRAVGLLAAVVLFCLLAVVVTLFDRRSGSSAVQSKLSNLDGQSASSFLSRRSDPVGHGLQMDWLQVRSCQLRSGEAGAVGV